MTSCSFAWRPSCLAEVGGWGGNQLLVCAHSHRPSPGTWSPCLILYTTVQRARQHIGKQVFVVVRAASGGSRGKKMLLKCSAQRAARRRRRATAAITLYLHLYSNKLTRRWWWDGPTECSPNTPNLHARALPKSHANIRIQFVCVCVCRFFFAKYLFRLRRFSVEFRAPFRTQVAPDSHHRAAVRCCCCCLVSLSWCGILWFWCCVRRRGSGSSKLIFDWDLTMVERNADRRRRALGRRTARVWFYASLSHKIFAPINIWTFL